jgi:hypothetical protein
MQRLLLGRLLVYPASFPCQAVAAALKPELWLGLKQQHHCCQADNQQARDRTSNASCSFNKDDERSVTWQLQQLSEQQQQQQQQQPSTCSTTQHLFGSQLQRQQRQQQQQQQQLLCHQLHRHQSTFLQLQFRRCFSARPLINPTMPQELATVINKHAAVKAERPPAPPLEPRRLAFESRRSGVIAIKAGMMQDWDEYGVRVPLTVLWIDECMVSCCARCYWH